MVRSVETIRKDIDALEATTASLAADFRELYSSYLGILGHAVRRQGVIATYHLCTQIYPEAFLALSVKEREKLQQDVQRLGRKAQDWLQNLMEPDQEEQAAAQAALEALQAMEQDEAEAAREAEEVGETGEAKGAEADDPPSDATLEPNSAASASAALTATDQASPSEIAEAESAAAMPPRSLIQSVLLAAMADKVEDALKEPLFTGDRLTPTQLAKQHLRLEKRIRNVLQQISNQINQCLQTAQVLPDLPEEVLEAATAADRDADHGHPVPNLLNVLVAMAGDMDEVLDQEDKASDSHDQTEDEDSKPSTLSTSWEALVELRDQSEDDQASPEADEASGMQPELLGGTMTHLAAINLRLLDIEFADVQASLWRGKLRTTLGRLRKVGKQYKQAQRELAIAEAEQAWRAVWYDNTSQHR